MRKQQTLVSTAWLVMITSTLLFASKSSHLRLRTLTPEKQKIWRTYKQSMSDSTIETGAISGTVFNVDVPNPKWVNIQAWSVLSAESNKEDSVWMRTTAVLDDDYNYIIKDLPTGDYFIEVFAAGYETQYYDGVSSMELATPVTVFAHEIATDVDFHMVAVDSGAGTVSGTVTDEKTGQPIPEANVHFLSTTFYCLYPVITDSVGEYELNIPCDTYRVQVFADGYLSEYYDNVPDWSAAELITVQDSSDITGIDFNLTRGCTISGIVTDSNQGPLEDVYILAMTELPYDSLEWTQSTDSRYESYMTATDSNGFYTITNLPEGSYFVRGEYYKNGGQYSVYYPGVTDPEAAVAVSVSQSSDVTDIDFQINVIPPIGVIEGCVTDSQGNPVQEAYVSLGSYPLWRSSRWYWEKAETDSLGHYCLENIPAGQYTVECHYDNHWKPIFYFWPGTTDLEEAQPIEISSENSSWNDIDFQLPITLSQASISGQVRAMDGHPLASAYIQVLPTEDSINDTDDSRIWTWVYSDSNGVYSIDHVPTGPYRIQCNVWDNNTYGEQWYDHAENEENAVVVMIQEETQLTGIDFELDLKSLYGSLSGIVLDQENHPVQNAYVEVFLDGVYDDISGFRNIKDLSSHTCTDINGQYHFPRLYHGDYRIAVYADGGYAFFPDAIVWQESEKVAIAGDDSATADFQLQIREYTATIQGQITSMWDNPIEPCEDSTSASLQKMESINPETFAVIAKPAITICSWPESESVYAAVTETDGQYTLQCPPGEYIVRAFSSNYLPKYYDNAYDPSKAKTVMTSENKPATDIDISLTPKLYWEVEDSESCRPSDVVRIHGCIQDENGSTLSAVTVYLYDINGNPVFSAVTNEQGGYDIPGLQDGAYYIQAVKEGIGSVFNGNVHSIEDAEPINLDQNDQEVNLVFNSVTNISSDIMMVPESICLIGNHPNPFNPQTEIRFALPRQIHVKLTIYNALGQKVVQIADRKFKAGEHQLLWTGMDENGNIMPSGLYLYRFEAGSRIQTRKMILMR